MWEEKKNFFFSHIVFYPFLSSLYNNITCWFLRFGCTLTVYQTTNFTLVQLKAFVDDKFNVTQLLKSVSGRGENIVGKGENAGYQGC